MPLTRAVIRSYSSSTQLAEIELIEGPRALQPAVPFVATFDTRYRKAAQEVLVENYPDQGPVIIAPWHVARQGNLQDWLYDASAMNFTAQTYTAYTGLIWTSTIVLVEPSYLWLFAQINFACSALRDLSGFFRWYVNAAQVDPVAAVACDNVSQQQVLTLAERSPLLPPATYSAQVECYVSNAGDTITCQYSGAGYIATPGE